MLGTVLPILISCAAFRFSIFTLARAQVARSPRPAPEDSRAADRSRSAAWQAHPRDCRSLTQGY